MNKYNLIRAYSLYRFHVDNNVIMYKDDILDLLATNNGMHILYQYYKESARSPHTFFSDKLMEQPQTVSQSLLKDLYPLTQVLQVYLVKNIHCELCGYTRKRKVF